MIIALERVQEACIDFITSASCVGKEDMERTNELSFFDQLWYHGRAVMHFFSAICEAQRL